MTGGSSLGKPVSRLPLQRPQQPSEDVGDYQPQQPLFTTRTPEGRFLIALASVDVGMLVAFLYLVSLTVYRAGGLVPTISAVSSESEVLLAAGTFAALWVAVQTERRESARDRRDAERRNEVVSPSLERRLDDAKLLRSSGSPIEPRKPDPQSAPVRPGQNAPPRPSRRVPLQPPPPAQPPPV
jgi:hypothetical protein